jgi:hypothetical protein
VHEDVHVVQGGVPRAVRRTLGGIVVDPDDQDVEARLVAADVHGNRRHRLILAGDVDGVRRHLAGELPHGDRG